MILFANHFLIFWQMPCVQTAVYSILTAKMGILLHSHLRQKRTLEKADITRLKKLYRGK